MEFHVLIDCSNWFRSGRIVEYCPGGPKTNTVKGAFQSVRSLAESSSKAALFLKFKSRLK
jgi:hypothetical protein